MLARVTSKGRVTIPKKVRTLLNLSYGDVIDFSFKNEKVILMKQNSLTSARALRGILKTKQHHTNKEIYRAKGLILSKNRPPR